MFTMPLRHWKVGVGVPLAAAVKVTDDPSVTVCPAAVLGHPEEALHAARREVELKPTENDHWEGPQAEENLAFVYAWTGDKTRAIEAYARLLQSPHVSPRMGSSNVHVMRHALWFAPLRGDPRWEALLNDPKNNAPLF
jgi:hypothetical protein